MAGRVCLWRYRSQTGDYAGFHLSADPAGCDQLLTLLGAMIRARAPRIGNIVLDPVTADVLAVPSNPRGEISAYRHWDLVVDPSFDPERLHFLVMNDRVRTELSTVQAESLMAGIEDIRIGRGDYAIGDDADHQLWFWWQRPR